MHLAQHQTYFPTHEMDIPAQSENDYFLIDGGVIANNPTMCAVSEVRNIWPHIEMEQIRVLSVGTGFMARKINGPESKKWGAAQWITHGRILDVLSDERVVAYQAMAILNRGAYIRVNAELQTQPGFQTPPDDAMDDVSRVNIKRLKKTWRLLVRTVWRASYRTDSRKLYGSIVRSD